MTAASSPIRIAVIGLGPMGLRHAKCVAAHPRAQLAAAVEVDATRTTVDLGCPIFPDASALIGKVDVAIVAVPTAFHAPIAVPLLEAGISCLIEKPVVATAAEGKRVAEAGARGNAVVRVGHIERFNPAMIALLSDRPQGIAAIQARRMSGASARVTDIDVVADLMVHDLDSVLEIVKQPVTSVAAAGGRDHAVASITFEDRTVATVTASRIAPVRIRDLDVLCTDRALRLDYLARTLSEITAGPNAPHIMPRHVASNDALTLQLSAFLDARDGKDGGVTLDEAMAVMDLAWRIQAALNL